MIPPNIYKLILLKTYGPIMSDLDKYMLRWDPDYVYDETFQASGKCYALALKLRREEREQKLDTEGENKYDHNHRLSDFDKYMLQWQRDDMIDRENQIPQMVFDLSLLKRMNDEAKKEQTTSLKSIIDYIYEWCDREFTIIK